MSSVQVNLPEVNLPPEAIGFLQRILGPLAEAGDFLSEKIRFYRWQSSLKTMERAEQIAREHGVEPKQVPLKILVPLLEKASLETEDSPLLERWATLLAQGSATPDQVYASFVDILSRLSADDVSLMESIVTTDVMKAIRERQENKNITRTFGAFCAATQDAAFERLKVQIYDHCDEHDPRSDRKLLSDLIEDAVNLDTISKVDLVTVAFYGEPQDDIYVRNEKFADSPSLDVLVASGLLTRRYSRFSWNRIDFSVDIIAPTPLGLHFVATCRGDFLPNGAANDVSQGIKG